LLATSFLVDGLDWPRRYLALLSNPELHPGPEHMPTLRGLVYALTGAENSLMLIGLSAVVVVALIVVARRSDLEFAFAFALIGGLLIGYHAYLQDCMILLLVFVLVLEHSRWPVLRGILAIALTPPIFMCLLSGTPFNAAVPLTLLLLLTLGTVHPAELYRSPTVAG